MKKWAFTEVGLRVLKSSRYLLKTRSWHITLKVEKMRERQQTSTTPISIPNADLTSTLFMFGIVAGPLFMGAGFLQALARLGSDLTRHPISLLFNGDLGWLQVANFLSSGFLIVAGAIGMRQPLKSGSGRF